MRKTKIIATIGPACDSEETLTKMCEAGMNVARLNFSHGTREDQQERINLVKTVREKLELPIAIMLDTKGPEYRIGTFSNKRITLKDGDTFTFTTEDIIGDDTRVSVSDKRMMDELQPGDTVLVNNGLVVMEVRNVQGSEAVCTVTAGGELSDRKSMNIPKRLMPGDYLREQDKGDILLGIQNEVDFIAASFVSTREDVQALRDFLDENGGQEIDIIAKIENRSGVDQIDEICKVANGIMIARGDLGVEIPFIEVPAIQKYLISRCRMLGKRVITATEMLESMIHNPRPTRAEISDVANAVYDGTSAVMLSGESAAGKYPVAAVKNMAEIAEQTEKNIDYTEWFRTKEFQIQSNIDAVSHATCAMAIDVQAKGIVVSSISGRTAQMVSRFRCPVDLIGMTTSQRAWYRLNLSWGITPVLSEEFNSVDVMFYHALNHAKRIFQLQKGENVVLTGGSSCQSGNTNTIRVEKV